MCEKDHACCSDIDRTWRAFEFEGAVRNILDEMKYFLLDKQKLMMSQVDF